MERRVKYRLITWFETVDDPTSPGGKVMREHVGHLGEVVDLPDSEAARLDDRERYPGGALYTDEENAAIEDGSYAGPDRHILAAARAGIKPQSRIEPADGEGIQTSQMDSQELGEYIKENNLTIPQTLDLLSEDADEDEINKLYDAEAIATDNSPRKGVADTLDARLAALAAA